MEIQITHSHPQIELIARYSAAKAVEGVFAQVCRALVTEEELRSVPGIGFKTARIFLVRSRRKVRHAVLDVWTLKFLKVNGVPNVPQVTPRSECDYVRLEAELLRLYDEQFPGLTPAEADEQVWLQYSGRATTRNREEEPVSLSGVDEVHARP
jgi:hypothetical protein